MKLLSLTHKDLITKRIYQYTKHNFLFEVFCFVPETYFYGT